MAKDSKKSPPNKEEPAKQDVDLLSHRIFTIMQQPKAEKKFMGPKKTNDPKPPASPPKKPK